MHMCVVTIIEVVVLVFAITAVGFGIGKLNKFANSDEILEEEE